MIRNEYLFDKLLIQNSKKQYGNKIQLKEGDIKMSYPKFTLEGGLEIYENEVVLGLNLPNVWDPEIAHNIDITTEPVKMVIDSSNYFRPINISGIGVGSVSVKYEKVRSCKCNTGKKIKVGKGKPNPRSVLTAVGFGSRDSCDCFLPGTLTITYQQTPPIGTMMTLESHPSSITILIDIDEDNIKIHWRKTVTTVEGFFEAGSTEDSVIIIERKNRKEDFYKFAVCNMNYNSYASSPLLIGVREIDEKAIEELYKPFVTIGTMGVVEDCLLRHNSNNMFNHFNIGDYAVQFHYTGRQLSYHTITPDGELLRKENNMKDDGGDECQGETTTDQELNTPT